MQKIRVQKPSVFMWVALVLTIAVVNLVAGRLALLLAVPPGYAAAVFPPAGIALACILVFGYRITPGIWLGSFLVNASLALSSQDGFSLLQIIIAASIGLGSSMQAIFGALLVRRVIGFPNSLDNEKDVSLFLLFGGPISCLVAPTWGVTTLLLSNLIAPTQYSFTWLTWWVGDTIGVLTFTPLVFIAFAKPREVWRRRRFSVAIPLCATFILAVFIFFYASARENERIRAEFERHATNLSNTLKDKCVDTIETLNVLEGVYTSIQLVTRKEFEILGRRMLSRQHGIHALEWVPHVRFEERYRYEDTARSDGYAHFQFTELTPQGTLTRVRERTDYYPIYYIEPYQGNERALGFDLGSEPTRQQALIQAQEQRQMLTTKPVTLVQQTNGEEGLLLVLPVYHKESRNDLQGYVVAVLLVTDILSDVIVDAKKLRIALRLEDITDQSTPQILYDMRDENSASEPEDSNNLRATMGLSWRTGIEMPGRRWSVLFVPSQDYLTSQRTLVAWTVLVSGLLFTGLLGAFLLAVSGRTTLIEALVVERTNKLSLANETLGQEISKHKETAESLRVAKVIADEANNAKSEFLASVSHEIRTPMNAILGMAELLASTSLSDEQRKYVDIFTRAGNNLLAIINDILDLSKVEASQFEIKKSDFNLYDLVDRTAETMALHAHTKGLELACHVAPDVPAGLVGDAARLRQVLVNLIGNAIKFTEHGEVVLRVDIEPDDKPNSASIPVQESSIVGLRFSVTDTGIGVPADMVEAVFEPFAQLHAPSPHEQGGTGLGLAICRRLVQLFGGRIWMESTVGSGTIVTFTARFDLSSSVVNQESFTLVGLNVLLVDDNQTTRAILETMLTSWNISVTQAANADEALAVLQEALYDIVLIDAQMPTIDGFELATRIKSNPQFRGQTLLMLTSDNPTEHILRARELDIRHYLLKPIQRRELLHALVSAKDPVERHVSNAPQSGQHHDDPTFASLFSGGKLRILLAEDSADNRLLVQAFLRNTPCEIDIAENGKIAVEMFKKTHYDLVLMDMEMPILDGYEATATIRAWEHQQERPPTPIIALTAHALVEHERKSLEAGCTVHLTKPIQKIQLLLMISQTIKESRKMKDRILVKGDPDIRDLIPDFLQNRREDLNLLHQALQQSNFEKIRSIGHRLKGDGGAYGLEFISQIGEHIEHAAKSKDNRAVHRWLNEMEDYLDRIDIVFD